MCYEGYKRFAKVKWHSIYLIDRERSLQKIRDDGKTTIMEIKK